MDNRIDRILNNIDILINRYYNYREKSIVLLSKRYVKNYMNELDVDVCMKELIMICNVCYLLALKFLLDNGPKLNDYCGIISVDKNQLLDKELDIAFMLKFKFNILIDE
jgi:hypothetical protein